MNAAPFDGAVNSLTARIKAWMIDSIQKHMPDEMTAVLSYEVSLYPLPTDTTWVPSVFLYLMLQPVGDVDGEHEGQFESPYGLTEQTVDVFVANFAERTEKKRQALRQARQEGKEPMPGVAVSDITD